MPEVRGAALLVAGALSLAPVVRGSAVGADASHPVASVPAGSCETEARLTREQATADLSDWVERFLAVHPAPEALLSAVDLRRRARATFQGAPDSMPLSRFFVGAASLMAEMRDSHTVLQAPSGSACLYLPVRAKDATLCLEGSVGRLADGACLDRIGLWNARDLVADARRLASAETEAGLLAHVPYVLPALLRARGQALPLTFSSGGEVETLSEAWTPAAAGQRSVFEASWLAGEVALLVLRTMPGSELAYFEQQFSRTFAEIAAHGARGIVVDLRDNDGGSTEVGELLLGYLTERPYRQFSRKIWRVSTLMQDHLRARLGPSAPYLHRAPGVLAVSESPIRAPTPRRARFTGPVIYLIGPETASAAMMLASAVEDFGLGVLLGEDTSSPPNYFAEVYEYRMKHSGLTASISTAAFVRPSGDAESRAPVRPHITIATPRSRRLSPDDRALALALHLLERAAVPGDLRLARH